MGQRYAVNGILRDTSPPARTGFTVRAAAMTHCGVVSWNALPVQPMPLLVAYALATAAASLRSMSADLLRAIKSSVVSAASTEFRAAARAASPASLLLTAATTLSAFWRCLSSSRTCSPRAEMPPSLEKTRPIVTLFWEMADLVSGPPASRALKLLNFKPYVLSRPGWQNGRVGHSDGPPRMRSPL